MRHATKFKTRITTKNAEWFDEDCRKAIKAKNEARNKLQFEAQGLIGKNI
jgi:hypothetical protein